MTYYQPGSLMVQCPREVIVLEIIANIAVMIFQEIIKCAYEISE